MPISSNEHIETGGNKRVLFRWILRLFKLLVLLAVLWLVFIFMGRALRQIAVLQITGLTNAKVEAESIDFSLDGSVSIKGLVVRPHRKQKYDDAILKAKAVYARFDIRSLLLLRPRLKEISVKDFVFNVQYNLDTDQWNIDVLKIKVPNRGFGKMPFVRLEEGTLQYSKVQNEHVRAIGAIPVDVRFGPAEKTQDSYNFKITTAERVSFGRSVLVGSWRPGRIVIAGGISSSGVPALEKGWTINILAAELDYHQDNAYALRLIIKDFQSKRTFAGDILAFGKPSFLEKFGSLAALRRFLSQYRPAGRIDIDLKASGNLRQLTKSTLEGKVYCKDVSIVDQKFPYPVQHIAGLINFTERGVELKNLTGRHGNVKIVFNGFSQGFGPNRRYKIQVTSDNMTLDDSLYQALNTKYKKLWSLFSPSGLTAINYSSYRQPLTGRESALAVELLGVEAVYEHFPYPLKNLTGKLFFKRDSVIASDVVSQLDERKITLNGQVTNCSGDRPVCDISIKAENLPLDATLAKVLKDKQKYFGDSFNLAGQCGGGSVSLTGRIWTKKESRQPRYRLSLYARGLELNDELFSLLPEPLKKIASELQPKGKVNINADLDKPDANSPTFDNIAVFCLGDSVNFNRFPYPLKDITGSLIITKDSVSLNDITAAAADSVQITPNASTIKLNGKINLVNNAFGSALFTICANDIFLDERLGVALPKGIRRLYLKLSPTGRCDLDFENIKVFSDDGGKDIDFGGVVRFKDCNFNASPDITGLDATLKIKGSYKTGSQLCDGQAALVADRLIIKGKALTRLKADIYYDRRRQRWLTKNLVADCCGGWLTGKLEFGQPAKGALEYLLQIGFGNIDLGKFLWDTKSKRTSGNDHTRGKMNGSLSITGHIGGGGRDNYPRIGRCKIQITDMQVGRLSPLAKLLYVLKLTEPKDFAFDRMFIDSYIRHNRLLFERLDLSGEAIAFNGSGSMDLQSKIVDLVLFARGRRLATAEPSILQSLVEDISRAVVRMRVTGNFYDPQVTTTTLPVIKQTLKILGTKPAPTN